MSGSTAIAAYLRAADPATEAKGTAALANDATLTRTIAAFRKAVASAKDLNSALRDPRVAAVVLPALGLPDQTSNLGLAARALAADPTDSKGLLSQLSDGRWKMAATTLNLHTRGLAGLRDPAVQANLVKALTDYTWRKNGDATTPGLSDALYFRDHAGSAKTAYDVLGDAVMRRVVTTALNLPAQIAVQTVETQARDVTAKLDIGKLTDPATVQKLAERYLMTTAASASGNTSSTYPSAPLLKLFT